MKEQKNMFPTKEQVKPSEGEFKEMEVSDFPLIEFKTMVIKILSLGEEWTKNGKFQQGDRKYRKVASHRAEE